MLKGSVSLILAFLRRSSQRVYASSNNSEESELPKGALLAVKKAELKRTEENVSTIKEKPRARNSPCPVAKGELCYQLDSESKLLDKEGTPRLLPVSSNITLYEKRLLRSDDPDALCGGRDQQAASTTRRRSSATVFAALLNTAARVFEEARDDLDMLMEAAETYSRAISAIEKELGPNNPETISGLISLSEVFVRMELHFGAESILQIAYTRSVNTLCKDHPTSVAIGRRLQTIENALAVGLSLSQGEEEEEEAAVTVVRPPPSDSTLSYSYSFTAVEDADDTASVHSNHHGISGPAQSPPLNQDLIHSMSKMFLETGGSSDNVIDRTFARQHPQRTVMPSKSNDNVTLSHGKRLSGLFQHSQHTGFLTAQPPSIMPIHEEDVVVEKESSWAIGSSFFLAPGQSDPDADPAPIDGARMLLRPDTRRTSSSLLREREVLNAKLSSKGKPFPAAIALLANYEKKNEREPFPFSKSSPSPSITTAATTTTTSTGMSSNFPSKFPSQASGMGLNLHTSSSSPRKSDIKVGMSAASPLRKSSATVKLSNKGKPLPAVIAILSDDHKVDTDFIAKSISRTSSTGGLSPSPLMAMNPNYSSSSSSLPSCESAAEYVTVADSIVRDARVSDRLLDAEALYRCAIAAYSECTVSNSVTALKARTSLASLYNRMMRYDSAEEQYRAILSELEKIETKGAASAKRTSDPLRRRNNHEHEHDTIISKTKLRLATSLDRQHKFGEAEESYRELLIYRELHLGYDHPATVISRSLLLHFLLRKHLEWRNDDDDDQEEELRPRKLSYRTMTTTAEECVKLGDLTIAQALYRRIIQTKEISCGCDSASAVTEAMDRLGQLYMDDDKLEAAEEMFRRVFVSYSRTLGDLHKRTLDAQVTYALALLIGKKLDESESLYHDALLKTERVTGHGSSETLQLTVDFAQLLTEQRKYSDAMFYLKRAVGGYENLLGECDLVTVSVRNRLRELEKVVHDHSGTGYWGSDSCNFI